MLARCLRHRQERIGGAAFAPFRQYFRFGENRIFPIVPSPDFRFGYIRLTVQQGLVTTYERSLITLSGTPSRKSTRWLPGGQDLEIALSGYKRRSDIAALYVAVKAIPLPGERLQFMPVWAVRLGDGTEETLAGPLPSGYDGSGQPRGNLGAIARTPDASAPPDQSSVPDKAPVRSGTRGAPVTRAAESDFDNSRPSGAGGERSDGNPATGLITGKG